MIKRILHTEIEAKLTANKAIIVMGPRQVGKTTLIKKVLEGKKYLFLNGDDPSIRQMLYNANTAKLENILGDHKYVFIDEAQRIDDIGIILKLITDQIPQVHLIVSGSSAFELANLTNEPLTGRKWEYRLYPISWEEYQADEGYVASEQKLELRLIFGMYPEVINHENNEVEVLTQLADSYLYKDILAFSGIRKPQVLQKLLRALAFQLGNEVSYNEVAQLVGIDKKTVANYIDLLEQSYVIFRLPSFSRNLRNEIKTNQKIYFYDNGIRNRLIGNFNMIENRTDIGALWENFLISERVKYNAYHKSLAQTYFWRTRTQQEVDYVEEYGGKIYGYEFKWNPRKSKLKFPQKFIKTYNAETKVITRNNFRDFLL